MDQTEFERRKRHLEAELEAGLELLRAGYRAQVRALEQLWLASPGEGVPGRPGASPHPVAEAPSPSALFEARASPAAEKKRRPANELYHQILGFFEQLPEVFDRKDILDRLDTKPHRSTLYGLLEELCQGGILAREERGRGIAATRYRRLRTPVVDTSRM